MHLLLSRLSLKSLNVLPRLPNRLPRNYQRIIRILLRPLSAQHALARAGDGRVFRVAVQHAVGVPGGGVPGKGAGAVGGYWGY